MHLRKKIAPAAALFRVTHIILYSFISFSPKNEKQTAIFLHDMLLVCIECMYVCKSLTRKKCTHVF